MQSIFSKVAFSDTSSVPRKLFYCNAKHYPFVKFLVKFFSKNLRSRGRVALVALRRERNSLGVFFLQSFFFYHSLIKVQGIEVALQVMQKIILCRAAKQRHTAVII